MALEQSDSLVTIFVNSLRAVFSSPTLTLATDVCTVLSTSSLLYTVITYFDFHRTKPKLKEKNMFL